MVEVKKRVMDEETIKQIMEVDKTFYLDMDYSSGDWYFNRYNSNNEVTVLIVDNVIVGYFIFYGVSENLFNRICGLEYDNDYYFNDNDIDNFSDIKYFASVLVKEEYRDVCAPLMLELERQFRMLDKVVAIAVSNEGNKMCSRYMDFVGEVNGKAKIYVKK